MSSELKPYKYFDSPDGHDTFKKLWVVLKPTALVAFAASTVDVLLYSHPKGYLKTLGRYAYVGWPIIGAATAFVMTTNLAASYRKKDDYVNWFVGGAAAGSIFGVWRKRTIVGFNMAMLLGIAALVKKDSVNRNWSFGPGNEVAIATGGIWSTRQDWSLTKHRPGNWTTGKE